jgi:hypothetical protein
MHQQTSETTVSGEISCRGRFDEHGVISIVENEIMKYVAARSQKHDSSQHHNTLPVVLVSFTDTLSFSVFFVKHINDSPDSSSPRA